MASKGRPLPEGWRIEGFWTGIGAGQPEYTEVTSQRDVTDADVANADRVVVSYTSRRTGVIDYRTVPSGATSKRALGNVIRYNTRVVSPVGRRSR